LNAFCIDKDLLPVIFSHPVVYTVHSVAPYDDLHFINRYLPLDGYTFLALTKDIAANAVLNKEEVATLLMEKYNIPFAQEAKESLVIALYMTTLQKEILKKASKIIYVSPHVKEKVKEFYGIERGKIIKNGINIFRNYEDKKDLINRVAKKWKEKTFPGKILVLYTGRVTEDKGVLDLVKAMESINSDNIVLFISGRYGEEIKEKISESPCYGEKVFLM
jgi:glycosyltransferase involved in cell wall biosynthesis